MVKYLYINGDCWLARSSCQRVLHDANGVFGDTVVINRSAPAANNLDIIERTRQDLASLQQQGIEPFVCIGLSEIGNGGHNIAGEFKLARPNLDLDLVLKSIVDSELKMLASVLDNRPSYVCHAWSYHTYPQKSLLHFIDQDWQQLRPVYAVTDGVYHWLADRSAIFKFTPHSFQQVRENQQQFREILAANRYLEHGLHLASDTAQPGSSVKVYRDFFQHVARSLDM